MEGNLDFGKNFDLTLHILPQSKFDLGGEKLKLKTHSHTYKMYLNSFFKFQNYFLTIELNNYLILKITKSNTFLELKS